MTNSILHQIYWGMALSILTFSLQTQACSESGKNEFTLDKSLLTKCGQTAQSIAKNLGNTIFPVLGKNENSDSRPSAPLQAGGLEPNSTKKSFVTSETIEKTAYQSRQATFPIIISTTKGNWECLYCVTFNIDNSTCSFAEIKQHHCASGVNYPTSKRK